MAWTCASCGFDGNDDSSIRCTCGQELAVSEDINYKKIGGGLYLVIFGLILTPIFYLVPLLGRLESGHVILLIEFIQTIIFVFMPIFLLFKLIKRHKSFPIMIICYYILGIILVWLNYYAFKLMPIDDIYYENLNGAIDTAVVTSVVSFAWILYFLKSKRAKMTFIN
jgi:hypothetical protein